MNVDMNDLDGGLGAIERWKAKNAMAQNSANMLGMTNVTAAPTIYNPTPPPARLVGTMKLSRVEDGFIVEVFDGKTTKLYIAETMPAAMEKVTAAFVAARLEGQ